MGFLRFLGTTNAAVWLGAVVSMTLAVLPAVFSNEMSQQLTGHPGDVMYTGVVAIVIFSRFFIFEYVCGTIAVIHAVAGSMYLGRPLRTLTNYVLLTVLALSLLGGFWLQPKIRTLHYRKFDAQATLVVRNQAARSLKIYHGLAEVLNVLALAGLGIYFWRVSHPNDPARFAAITHKFRS